MPYTNVDMAVTLPNSPISPSQILQQGIQLKERQQERADSLAERQRQFDEREKDRQLANQYKNADIIAEGTDLSKHLTGDTIANDIATQSLAKVLPQFVSMAKSGASPVDLQMAITKGMNNIVPALDNIKREFQLGDEAAKKLKELHPELNTESLLTDFRKDIHNRTIDQQGNLVAAHLVQPSPFQQQLTNPDFLSRYVEGNKNLVEAITNPKGADAASALVGNADSHVKYEAKIPFWKTPNYTPAQAVGGYLPSNITPQLKIKASELPMDKIDNNGKPFNIIDEDVYNRFAQDPKSNLELIAATRRAYPQYDQFNQTEKDYIKRHILYNQINALDQSEFHPTGGTKAPRTNVSINNAAAAKQDVIDNNSGTLMQHLEDAVTNNPVTMKVPLKGGGWGSATWGDLGKSDLTEPFKVTVTESKADNKPSVTKSVPFDKYLVDQDNKIYGVYYERVNGEPTHTIQVQKEIPLERYTERLIKGTTPLKYRAEVVKQNVEEVRGSKKTAAPKVTEEDFNEKWSKLKKGESMVAPNGKTYVKK